MRKKHATLNKEAEQLAAKEDRERERERRERDRHRREKDDPTNQPSTSSNSFITIYSHYYLRILDADEEREEAAVKERYLGIIKVSYYILSKISSVHFLFV